MTGKRHHEKTDARATPLILFSVGLAAFVVITLIAMAWMFRVMDTAFSKREPKAHPLAITAEKPQGPLLQVVTARDFESYRGEQSRILNSYGWISREAGVVRIPIEQAMELVVEKKELKSR